MNPPKCLHGLKGRINPYTTLSVAVALPVLLVFGSAFGTAQPDKKKPKPETPRQVQERQFATTIRPFLQTYCTACHGKDKPQAQLDLIAYNTMDAVRQNFPHWSLVREKLEAKQMPPTGTPQPTEKERAAVMAWIQDVRQYEASQNAGDPGPVLARRLSNSEYDYTIRDLTGVDLKPTREFPVDPANQEGFDNSGESLTLSPALTKKYIQAAKDISEHLVLTSTGLEFASHPVMVETDRDKFCVLRIVDFYKQQPTDFADYFYAAWRYRYRVALATPDATLTTIAAEANISPRYLETVWKALTTPQSFGPMAQLQTRWNALPDPYDVTPDMVQAKCVEMRDWTVAQRKKFAWKFENLRVPRGFSNGGQCFVLWKDQQYASHRRMLYPDALQIGGVPKTRVIPARRRDGKEIPEQSITDPVDADLFVPQDESGRAPYLASLNQFCSVFPDAFYIAERGRMFVNEPGDKGRLLSAGLHNSMGYFRDDTPLMELVLDEKGRQKLNHLWMDFDEVAFIPERMHSEFFVYERAESGTITDPEFNFARAEDKEALSDAKIKLLGDLYLAKAKRNGAEEPALKAIEEHFTWVSSTIRGVERARIASEPVQLKALVDFAGRAYRRPLKPTERTGLLAFYQSLRKKDGLTHEEAMRDIVASILMSPNFLFRLDLDSVADSATPTDNSYKVAMQGSARLKAKRVPPPAPSGKKEQPLSDYALANRLSYFLWASMPDKELIAHATAGDLHKPEVLKAQTRRMLKDPRIRALALEFGGNWLDFRRFEEHNAVDRNRFPTFDNNLREAMFEEPVRFLVDEYQNNRSVLEMLYGKHTFVNAPLAQHYGMTDVTPTGDQWVRVDNADYYNRGGLLPMAVFLTKNSPGLRTSPVKRGYWVVRRLLGEYIPPPPATVPELPADESKLGNLTLRQALAEHRKNPACASCHARFDSYGLVFEGFGPIGELRSKDMGGKPVDTKAPFPGGQERTGVKGLQEFVWQQRKQDFVDNLCHKMLAYALGRTLLPTDDAMLQQMEKQLAKDEYRFNTLVETIVTSRQFCNRRAPATVGESKI